MRHPILENKNILTYLYQFFNKKEDKEAIFILASQSKRVNSLLDKPLSDTYTYTIKEENIQRIPSRYKSLKIILPNDPSNPELYNETKIVTMIETVGKQIELNKLESFEVKHVFQYYRNSKTLLYMSHMSCNYDMYTVMCALDKYKLNVVKIAMITNSKSESMAQIMSKHTNLKSVYLAGTYHDTNENYSNIKNVDTNTSSLYLLHNFRNIVNLDIMSRWESTINLPNHTLDGWKNGLVLPDLKTLHIHYACEINLKDLLTISPNLESISIVSDKSTILLDDVEKIVKSRTTNFVSTTEMLQLAPPRFSHTNCIFTMSVIISKYVNIISGKYKNIKSVDFCGCNMNIDSDVLNYIDNIEKVYSGILSLNQPSDDVYGIVLYAYKIVCAYITSSTTDRFTVDFCTKLKNM